MLVSIIVPVFNVKKYLSQCLDSLINQTYTKIEIIIVNDKSTDGSDKICEEYVKRDRRIVLINKKINQGLGMARNTGIEVANGKYVIFVDSDDYVSNTMVESLVNIAEKKAADTCIGAYKIVDDYGNIKGEYIHKYEEFQGKDIVEKCLMRIIGSSPEKKDSIRPMVWYVLYSINIIKNNKLLFPSERELIAEDMVFNLEYYMLSKKVILLDNAEYFYRLNNDSITRKKYRENLLQKNLKLYKYEKQKLKDKKIYILAEDMLKRQFFISLLGCLSQEVPKRNGKSFKQCIGIYKDIVNNEEINQIIENYPINKLEIKQKVFLYLIKYKMYRILFFIIINLYK